MMMRTADFGCNWGCDIVSSKKIEGREGREGRNVTMRYMKGRRSEKMIISAVRLAWWVFIEIKVQGVGLAWLGMAMSVFCGTV